MKKILCALLAALTLVAASACAEKINLWEHTAIIDEAGNTQKTIVTLTTENPVDVEFVTDLPVADTGYVIVSRENVAPIVVVMKPADVAAHANLNAATDEQLMQYIEAVGEQYDNYSYEIQKSESGNVYLAITDEDRCISELWTIYEDTLLDMVQFNEGFTPLTAEDQAFAVEIFQGIWME